MDILSVFEDIKDELLRAKRHEDKFHSAHEAYGVILEELEEFWDHCKQKKKDRSHMEMYTELIQIAAMAIKSVDSLDNMVGGLT